MGTTEIVMFNGFDELDVVAPFEILVSAGYQVELVTFEPCQSVTGRHGMTRPAVRALNSPSGVPRSLCIRPNIAG